MHAGSVRRRRIRSGNRSSEGSQCLGTSRCVGRCLKPLSLALSLAPGCPPFEVQGSVVMLNSGHGVTILPRPRSRALEQESPSGSCRRRSRSVPRTGNLAWSRVIAHLIKRFSAWCEGSRSACRWPSSGSRQGQMHQSWMMASANRIGGGLMGGVRQVGVGDLRSIAALAVSSGQAQQARSYYWRMLGIRRPLEVVVGMPTE
jgi:hypothetical protein